MEVIRPRPLQLPNLGPIRLASHRGSRRQHLRRPRNGKHPGRLRIREGACWAGEPRQALAARKPDRGVRDRELPRHHVRRPGECLRAHHWEGHSPHCGRRLHLDVRDDAGLVRLDRSRHGLGFAGQPLRHQQHHGQLHLLTDNAIPRAHAHLAHRRRQSTGFRMG